MVYARITYLYDANVCTGLKHVQRHHPQSEYQICVSRVVAVSHTLCLELFSVTLVLSNLNVSMMEGDYFQHRMIHPSGIIISGSSGSGEYV